MSARLSRILIGSTLVALLVALAAPASAQRGGTGGRGAAGRAGGARGQSAAPPAARGDSIDFRRHDFSVVAVSPHPWSTVVAITVLLPTGSADDPRELPGTSWLLGQSVRDALASRLERLGATVSVDVGRTHTTFQAIAHPGAWEDAYQSLVEGLFAASLDLASLNAHRAEILSVFRFESGAPSREFQSEFASLVGGAGSPWGREPRGSLESVQRITGTDLNAHRRRVYTRDAAIVTVVGGLDAEPGVRVHPGGNGDSDDLRGRRAAGGGSAWTRRERRRLNRPVTNAWIGAAFPARRDIPRTSLEFIADRLHDDLNPTPRDPGLYGTQVRIEDLPDGPVILVEAAVLPEDHARWEERIVGQLRVLEKRYEDASWFSLHRRRFLNTTLVSESAPEAEGERIARDLLREGRVRDLPGEIYGLTSDMISRAITTLGQPRILVLGPELGR